MRGGRGRAPGGRRRGALSARSREALVVAGLVAVALVLRLVHWQRSDVMFDDGPKFLALAKQMAEGDLSGALAHAYHPLYPGATAAVASLLGSPGGDFVPAAVTVSVVSGAVAVLCLYHFARSAFGASAAWIAALALAVHPYAVRYSSDVQSDGLYLALFLAAVALLWRALREARPALAGGAGALAGLAYLTRPEGLGVALAGAGLAALAALRGDRLRWLGWTAALGLGVAIVAGPYVATLRLETGAWELTQKKSVARIVGLDDEEHAPPAPAQDARPPAPGVTLPSPPAPGVPEPDALSRAGRIGPVLTLFARNVVSTARPEMLLLFAAGLWAARGRPGPRAVFAGALAALYGCVLLAFAHRYGYLSHRHVLPPLVLGLGWVALGVPALGAVAARALGRLRGAPAGAGRQGVAVALGTLLLVTPSLAKGLRPREPAGLAERRAAEWLRAQDAAPGAVAASKSRVAYYAGAPHVQLRVAPEQGFVAWLQAQGVRYVVAGGPAGDEPAAVTRARAAGLPLLHEVAAGDEQAFVFAVPAPEAPGVAAGEGR